MRQLLNGTSDIDKNNNLIYNNVGWLCRGVEQSGSSFGS